MLFPVVRAFEGFPVNRNHLCPHCCCDGADPILEALLKHLWINPGKHSRKGIMASAPCPGFSKSRDKAQRDYVLALKANHPTLYSQVKEWFEQAQAQQFHGIDVS